MIVFVLVAYFYAAETEANSWQPSEKCLAAETSFLKAFRKLQAQYRNYSNIEMLDENKPTWHWGHLPEAVYLSHGFIGTPEEMASTAKALEAKGYTVINDIIPGHGLDGYVANKFDENFWRMHVNKNIRNVATCFSKIHFVGFSTGALLIHDFLIRNQKFNAASVSFYSPFYQPRNQYSGFLKAAARFFTPVVSTSRLYFLTHFPDIKVAILKPRNYLQLLPLDASDAVIRLGESVSQSQLTPLNTPALVFASDTDMLNSTETALRIMARDFPNLTVDHFTDGYVPHHLMVREVSVQASAVIRKTVQFISDQ